MTDDELLGSLLDLIDERFGRDIGPGNEWLTPRDAPIFRIRAAED